MVARVFPRLAPFTCICFEFSLVHCTVYVCCNLSGELLWFGFYDTQTENRSKKCNVIVIIIITCLFQYFHPRGPKGGEKGNKKSKEMRLLCNNYLFFVIDNGLFFWLCFFFSYFQNVFTSTRWLTDSLWVS